MAPLGAGAEWRARARAGAPLELAVGGGAGDGLRPVEVARRRRGALSRPAGPVEELALRGVAGGFAGVISHACWLPEGSKRSAGLSKLKFCFAGRKSRIHITSRDFRVLNVSDNEELLPVEVFSSKRLGRSTSSFRGFFPEAIFRQFTSTGVDTFVSTPLCH